MEQRNKYLTVKALNRYIAYKFESDSNLQRLYVQGEISNARISKGHLYFVLKDDESEIGAVMFANYLQTLKFTPKDGTKVLVVGNLNLYQKKGTYSLIIYSMEEYGIGDIYQNFLQLKTKLEKEGLFAIDHKKLLPKFPKAIGIISSKTADGLQDILSTINKRYPLVKIYLYFASVQGKDAPPQVIKMIKQATSDNKIDVLIIARGGGSFEDLSAFNDEALAHTIYQCPIPVISGVGHETDFTICDFVSDFRAPTPTGAAVAATPDRDALLNEIASAEAKIVNAIKIKYTNVFNKFNTLIKRSSFLNFPDSLENRINNLDHLLIRLNSLSPINQINQQLGNIKNYESRLNAVGLGRTLDEYLKQIERDREKLNVQINNVVNTNEDNIKNQIGKLQLLNPLNIIAKGYSVVYKDENIVSSVDEVEKDDQLKIVLKDGFVTVNVKNKNKKE